MVIKSSGGTSTHVASGVTAGTYGPTEDFSIEAGGSLVVPSITVNSTGHITSAEDKTVNLPALEQTLTESETSIPSSSAVWNATIKSATAEATSVAYSEGASVSVTTEDRNSHFSFSIPRGSDPLYLVLDPESIPISCSSSGAVLSSALPLTATARVFEGATDVTSDGWTFSMQSTTEGAVCNTDGNIINIIGYNESNESLFQTLTATRSSDNTTITKSVLFYKARAGSGTGVSSITAYYLASASSSGVTTSTSGWSTTAPTITSTLKYLWNYYVFTYTDSSYTTTTPCIIGAYGDTGSTGATGATGATGSNATISSISASITDNGGSLGVTATSTAGSNNSYSFAFTFSNIATEIANAVSDYLSSGGLSVSTSATNYTFTASTTSYTISSYSSTQDIDIYYNGLYMVPSVDYTISSAGVVTFTNTLGGNSVTQTLTIVRKTYTFS